MHNDDGKSVRAVGLPVAMAENLCPVFDVDQAFFAGRGNDVAWKQKAANGLQMSAAQSAARLKCWFVLRGAHAYILNG